MTTIILVSIGVLLAAAAALMMFFYGGDAFNNSELRSEAARLVSEGAQVEYAATLYYHQEGNLPGRESDGSLDGEKALEDLLGKKYLTHMPVGSKLINSSPWDMVYGTDGMIYTTIGAEADENAINVCKEARRQLGLPDPESVYQCDGSDYPGSHPAGTLPDREPCCIRQ